MNATLETAAARLSLFARIIEGAVHQPNDWTYESVSEDGFKLAGPMDVSVSDRGGLMATFSVSTLGGVIPMFLCGEHIFSMNTAGHCGDIDINLRVAVPSFV